MKIGKGKYKRGLSPMQRFMQYVDTMGNITGDECWLWLGALDASGYGNWHPGKLSKMAHRSAWQLWFGPIPDGMFVCHSCDRPSCVNPEHLFVATQKENIADCRRKGRRAEQKMTHCRRGHLRTPETTYTKSNGLKECKLCWKSRKEERKNNASA